MENEIKFHLIIGLISDVIDKTWSIHTTNGIFGQCILYHDNNIMANIGINGNLMRFTCNRGVHYELNVDLHSKVPQQIKNILNHLLKYESQPAVS